jgi:hypothetical protein
LDAGRGRREESASSGSTDFYGMENSASVFYNHLDIWRRSSQGDKAQPMVEKKHDLLDM